MQNKEQYVYNCLKRVNPRVAYVPLEDVMQEIRYALLVSGEEDFLRVSSRLVNRLIRAYGHTGRELLIPEGYDVPSGESGEHTAAMDERLEQVRRIYMDEGYSIALTCAYFNAPLAGSIRKLFADVFPKRRKRRSHGLSGGGVKQVIEFITFNIIQL